VSFMDKAHTYKTFIDKRAKCATWTSLVSPKLIQYPVSRDFPMFSVQNEMTYKAEVMIDIGCSKDTITKSRHADIMCPMNT
jgi:hypothetical protein